MTEWSVVGVAVTLVGLIATFVKLTASLTKGITTLTVEVKGLRADLNEHRDHSRESHRRIWAKHKEHDTVLCDHEQRIMVLENHKEVRHEG